MGATPRPSPSFLPDYGWSPRTAQRLRRVMMISPVAVLPFILTISAEVLRHGNYGAALNSPRRSGGGRWFRNWNWGRSWELT